MKLPRHFGPRCASRIARFTLLGMALTTGCRDAPTAPENPPGLVVKLDVEAASFGTPASELPPAEVIAAVAEPATIPRIRGITYTGQPEQVAVLAAIDGGFPTEGPTYLVVSSGDARDPRTDGAWTWWPHWYDILHGCTCYPGTGDEASVRITVELPVNATSLELDYRFFTADDVHWIRPLPWHEWSSVRVEGVPSGTGIGAAYGSPAALATCGHRFYVRCWPADFTWFPNGTQRLTVDVRSFAGQTVVVTADARDFGRTNTEQTGVAIDGLRVVPSNLPPVPNPGGPYIVDEGTSVEHDASASWDPEGGELTYAWDLDADGLFDDGVSPKAWLTFPDNGTYPIAVKVTDAEGISATAATTVTVRNVAPTLSLTAPSLVNPVLAAAVVPLEIQFTDPGADTYSATIDCDNGLPPIDWASVASPIEHICSYTTSAFGPRAIRVSVADDDGGVGTSSQTTSILYRWTGFLSPVENRLAINVAKAGSAIPLKFALAGYQGPDIMRSGSPASRRTACESDPSGTPEATVTPGESRLSYDAGAGQYEYVWKTEKAWTGTCRQLLLTLADGSVHQAEFRFK